MEPSKDATLGTAPRIEVETGESDLAALFDAFRRLESAPEAAAFLRDLCTPAELRAFAERWRIARRLADGASYRAIAEEVGASTATVVRVARFLRDEPHQGYACMLRKVSGESPSPQRGEKKETKD